MQRARVLPPAAQEPGRAADPPPGRGGKASRAWTRWLTGAVLLAGVVAAVTHVAEERELVRQFREAQPFWLIGAGALQVATYACAAAVWQRALGRRGIPLRLASLVPLAVAKLFTDQAVPSAGMSGTLLVVRGLTRRGVPRTAAMAVMLTGLVAFYLGYLAATVAAVTMLWRRGELGLLILLPAAALGVVAIGLPLALLALRRLRRLPPRLERWPGVRDVVAALREAPAERLFPPRLLAETALLQLAVFALDALTLGATLLAVGSPAPFSIVFASFVLASVVSTLTWVPGGLGTFEASCVALLHVHGVPLESAFAATLLLRGLTFWLPMIPGFTLARRETAPAPTSAARG